MSSDHWEYGESFTHVEVPFRRLDGLVTEQECAADISSSGGASDRYIKNCEFNTPPGLPSGFNTFTLIMEEDTTYNLELAKVGVGTGATYDGAHYITNLSQDQGSMVDNAEREFTFIVRDRFNNPVSGTDVTLTAPDDTDDDELTADGNTGNPITATTDENGKITVTYDPNDVSTDSTETRRITAEGDFDDDGTLDAIETAQYKINIVDAEAQPNVGSSINPAGPIILSDSRVAATQPGGSGEGEGSLDCGDDGNECLVKFELSHTNPPGAKTWVIQDLRYHFYIAPLSPGAGNRDSPAASVDIYDDDTCASGTYQYQENFHDASALGTITPTGSGSTKHLVLDFNDAGTNFDSLQGDGIIMTIIFKEQGSGTPGNTFSATYFLSPVRDETYDSGCV